MNFSVESYSCDSPNFLDNLPEMGDSILTEWKEESTDYQEIKLESTGIEFHQPTYDWGKCTEDASDPWSFLLAEGNLFTGTHETNKQFDNEESLFSFNLSDFADNLEYWETAPNNATDANSQKDNLITITETPNDGHENSLLSFEELFGGAERILPEPATKRQKLEEEKPHLQSSITKLEIHEKGVSNLWKFKNDIASSDFVIISKDVLVNFTVPQNTIVDKKYITARLLLLANSSEVRHEFRITNKYSVDKFINLSSKVDEEQCFNVPIDDCSQGSFYLRKVFDERDPRRRSKNDDRNNSKMRKRRGVSRPPPSYLLQLIDPESNSILKELIIFLVSRKYVIQNEEKSLLYAVNDEDKAIGRFKSKLFSEINCSLLAISPLLSSYRL